jgi:hypothetical protein
MNFSIFNNLKPIQFYFVSIISFVTANLIRDESLVLYYILLIFGLISFVFGLIKRMKDK